VCGRLWIAEGASGGLGGRKEGRKGGREGGEEGVKGERRVYGSIRRPGREKGREKCGASKRERKGGEGGQGAEASTPSFTVIRNTSTTCHSP